MGEFFYGWRRKAGWVMLVNAAMFAGAWVRSETITDSVCFAFAMHMHSVTSCDGMVSWYTSEARIDERYFRIASAAKSDPMFHWTMLETFLPESDRQWTVLYWWWAVPLTIVSAYLILRPGKRQERPSTQS